MMMLHIPITTPHCGVSAGNRLGWRELSLLRRSRTGYGDKSVISVNHTLISTSEYAKFCNQAYFRDWGPFN